ncbi:SRPBCC family protein [Actinomadura sp. KC216]|uniref:SRPBCC family protein n=1 Tax=Actinomadura sp. KC216 TaxID=2530370 RepID=UPI0010495B7F|nr:SRPBCC family protein [Actinomadura sp. KC216]TDB74843.1 SRPBCC family protein [Actinomadura sp. KC216]
MTIRHRLSGRVRVPLPPDEAFDLFTPRGEERWVPGWHPRFPVDGADDTEPGTVFETVHDGDTTIWLVLARDPHRRRISYARVTPGHRAGTVTVDIAGDGTATVTYDLTALTGEAARDLDAFAAAYPAHLRSWEDAIAAHLS